MADRSFLAWPFFEGRHRAFAERFDAWCLETLPRLEEGHDHHSDAGLDAACRSILTALGDGGWLRNAVPVDGPLDVRTLCLTRETLARHSGLADFVFAMQGLGTGPISLFGTDAQRAAWLPRVASGEVASAFALSEPEAGSDAAALKTTARLDGDDWVIDGTKTWISNGGIAGLYVVFARTGEAPGARGLSAFIVPGDAEGLSVVERIPVIAPHPLATLKFDGVRVRRDALIGEAGSGFKVAMGTLDVFRSTVGAAALGFARRAFDESLKRASERQLFGAPLSDLQMVQGHLADMALKIDASALLIYRAAWTKDSGAPRVTREAAMAKLYATDEAQAVIDAAVQLHGGEGVRSGSVVEGLYREIRALRIYEGASDVQKVVIARQALAGVIRGQCAKFPLPPSAPADPLREGREISTLSPNYGSDGGGVMDTFVRDNLPPHDQLPEFIFDLPDLHYPEHLNASQLIDRAIAAGRGDHPAVVWDGGRWTYRQLDARIDHIARVLVEDMGMEPGNRVLLHGSNRPETIAAWFAVARAGGVIVATMPLLRAAELAVVIDKAQVTHALADVKLKAAVEAARTTAPVLETVSYWGIGGTLDEAEALEQRGFDRPVTRADDPVLIAFTSGTTGQPKGCVHFHRDVFAMADTFSRHVLKPEPDEVFAGTPPYAFTFGLGGLVIFPIAAGATIACLERPGFEALCEAIERHGVTTLFTAPTGYRALIKSCTPNQLKPLRKCVSAGETLPAATSDAWFEATGIRIIDGIGTTEMIHIFISASGDDIRPGATGKPVPGYRAEVQDEDGRALPLGSTGRLAVKGPTGCRYLADSRQSNYVRHGWNLTGDVYRTDEDGYFWFVARGDDMIVSSGYNIGAPEVEAALLKHPAVAECAVVGWPDAERGQIVKAFVVLNDPAAASPATAEDLQGFVKNTIAPYKYPRAVEFRAELPKTQTGKLQRFRLKQEAGA
jgi:2-aminobenzoate-CoA ligase